MDRGTFDHIRGLRRHAQEVANDHEPPADQGYNATPEERFKSLGRFIMAGDDFPRTREYGGKEYTVHAFLPGDITVRLLAITSSIASHPTVDDLVTVKAEWSAGSVDHPLHVDSVSNISDSHSVHDSDLKDLALVEESFAEAKPHAAAI